MIFIEKILDFLRRFVTDKFDQNGYLFKSISSALADKLTLLITDSHFAKTIEIGCGSKPHTLQLIANGRIEESSHYFVDILDIKLRALCADHSRLVVADIEKLPFRNKSFDLVVCMETITIVPDQLRALEQLCYQVSQGGSLVVSGHSQYSLLRFIAKRVMWFCEHPAPISHDNVNQLVKSNEFSLRSCSYLVWPIGCWIDLGPQSCFHKLGSIFSTNLIYRWTKAD